MASLNWLDNKHYEHKLSLRLLRWVALTFGRRVTRIFLYPITLLYFFTTTANKATTRAFLSKALGRKVSHLDIFKHYHTFAGMLLDRIYLVSGKLDRFDIHIEGEEILRDYVAKRQGVMLLGSHLGSFDVSRGLIARIDGVLDVKAVMHTSSSSAVMNELLYELNPDLKNDIIPAGNMATFLEVKEAIDRGAMVGILGDRVLNHDKVIACEFMGKPALFPTTPYVVAHTLKVPMILMFGIYMGGNKYTIYFEKLMSPGQSDCLSKEELQARFANAYAERLAHYAKRFPYNWFNFYDFWAMPKQGESNG